MASDLEATSRALCARGKGILAADESPGTLGKRFKATPCLSHLENSEENRRAYRELLVTSDIGAHISGVILHEEMLVQSYVPPSRARTASIPPSIPPS